MIITNSKITKLANEQTNIGPFRIQFNRDTWTAELIYEDLVIILRPSHDTTERLRAIAEGLLGVNSFRYIGHYDIIINFIDFIYNLYNVPIIFANGKVKQSVKNELIKRIDRQYGLPYGDYLLNKVLEIDPTITQFDIPYLSITNHITNEPYNYCNYIHKKLNTMITKAPMFTLLSNLGYIEDTDLGWISPDQTVVLYEGNNYFEFQLLSCSECGTKHPHTKLYAGLCKHCLKIDPALIKIRNYTERAPDFIKMKTGKYSKILYKTPLLFGIELEYETTNMDLALLKTARLLGNHAIFKRDGTINNGFEIVTTGATFDIQEEEFSTFFKDFPRELFNASNVGMHIHVSKAPLSVLTRGKIVEFMNRHDNKNFIEAIAGRKDNRFCKQDVDRTVTYPFIKSQTDRYNVVNLNNAATLEFRIFATPTDFKTFMQRLDFVNALVAYCSPCQTKASNLKQATHHTSFIEYVKEHKHTFKYIYGYLYNNVIEARGKLKEIYYTKQFTKGVQACA